MVDTGYAIETDYVGREICAECHAAAAALWRRSHHAAAMQRAEPTTVRGSFNNRTFSYNGVTTEFYRRDDRFYVRTDNSQGLLEEFEIVYTFGVDPLQQYLIERPGGRLQAFGIAWDTRRKVEGGERWFHLYPGAGIDHTDPLHWTRRDQNWNYMCAECHSTGLRRRYDPVEDQYATYWSEINVSCEACHGPGREHVAWASNPSTPLKDIGLAVQFPPAGPDLWSNGPNGPQRVSPLENRNEVETCARCHSRRSRLTDDYRHGRSLLDSHRPALLEDRLYFPDGQIRDEVYVYGSFLQSRMYRHGVTCSDCHEPHSGALRAAGNGVCLQCHRADKYETRSHHFHREGSRGAQCVDCHMPERTYMVVDPRRDHSIRVPRPDLSQALDTPNACANCHTDQDRAWVVERFEDWYGELSQHYGAAIHAGRNRTAGSEEKLWGVIDDPEIPAIARATAVSLLAGNLSPAALSSVNRLLSDDDNLIRLAALEIVETLEPQMRKNLATHLLDDPLLSVRIAAARALASVPAGAWGGRELQLFERALAEYVEVQQNNAERPEAHLNLGLLYATQGRADLAQQAYSNAIRLDAAFEPAYVNLADLFRALGRDRDGESLLRGFLARNPDHADSHHALGLLLVRTRRLPEALEHLRRALELAPEAPRYGYVYAVALKSAGKIDTAVTHLEAVLTHAPNHRDTLYALVTFNLELGNVREARHYLDKLLELAPNDPDFQRLSRQLSP